MASDLIDAAGQAWRRWFSQRQFYHLMDAARRGWRRSFPQRQFYYRGGGEFRFVSVSPRQQILAASVFAGVVIWSGYAITGLVIKERMIAVKSARIAKIAADYDLLAVHVHKVQGRLLDLAEELEAKHEVLDRLAEQNILLSKRVGTLSGRLQQTTAQLHGAQEDHAALEEKYHGVEERRQALRSSMKATAVLVDSLTADRDVAVREGERLQAEVAALQNRLTALESAQEHLVTRIEERTDTNITRLETLIESTGLSLEKLLGRVQKEGGVGGPFIGLAEPGGPDGEAVASEEVAESLDRLQHQLVHWSALTEVMEHLPLSAPVERYWISSTFGKRRDPMTRRWAVHHGIDLAGPKKQAVYSTAAGIVTFAGRNGPYGRMVEIDHGFGIKTRYGHLRKITVKKGQQVDYREKIGLLGNSGRSTGSHVHYEIHFDDKPINPIKLMQAGKHVLEDGENE